MASADQPENVTKHRKSYDLKCKFDAVDTSYINFWSVAFSSPGRAIHISWSKFCLSVCLHAWMLTRVTCNFACTDLLLNPDCAQK